MAVLFPSLKQSFDTASGKTAALLGVVSMFGLFVLAHYCIAINFFPERVELQELLPLLFLALVAGVTALVLFVYTMVAAAVLGIGARWILRPWRSLGGIPRNLFAALAFAGVSGGGWILWVLFIKAVEAHFPAELWRGMVLTAATWTAWQSWRRGGNPMMPCPAGESPDKQQLQPKDRELSANERVERALDVTSERTFGSIVFVWLAIFCAWLMTNGGFVILASTAARIAGLSVYHTDLMVPNDIGERLKIAAPLLDGDAGSCSPKTDCYAKNKGCMVRNVDLLFQGIGDKILVRYGSTDGGMMVLLPSKDIIVIRERSSHKSLDLMQFVGPPRFEQPESDAVVAPCRARASEGGPTR